jgi:hypothetical protein
MRALSLGTKSRSRRLKKEINKTSASIRELDRELKVAERWRITLDPYVDALELIPLYKLKKIKIPAEIKLSSKKFDFYDLTFGGDILVKKGMSVRRLDLDLVFDVNLRKNARHAIAHSIFPTTEWRKYGEASLTFGVTGNLGFKVPIAPSGVPIAKIGDIGPQVKGSFVLGPFGYSFKKAVIKGAGKGNFKVSWTIEKGKVLEGGDFETRVVLKVPKGRRVVKTRAGMQATVAPASIFWRVWGRKRTIAPDEKTYDIRLK